MSCWQCFMLLIFFLFNNETRPRCLCHLTHLPLHPVVHRSFHESCLSGKALAAEATLNCKAADLIDKNVSQRYDKIQ